VLPTYAAVCPVSGSSVDADAGALDWFF